MSSKITALTALTSVQPDDVLPGVDVHDTTQASSGTTKKIAVSDLQTAVLGAAPPGDASAFLTGGGTWAPPPGFYPPAGTPRIPRTILTQFQSGHGFTLAGADASSNINDATAANFVCGSQAATVVTKGDGATFANLTSTALSFDSTSKYLLVRFRLSSAATVGNLHLDIATDSGFANFYRWDFHEKFSLGSGYAYDNEWEVITLSFGDATVTGSPARSGLTAARLRIRDTGAAITCQWQEISLVDDPAGVFPNGVVSICFDDGYQTQYDNARPVMDQYGFRGTMHLIRDGIGGSGSLTWAEVAELQNFNGWEIGCHADTSAVHQATDTGVTGAALETDWRDQKAYYNQNGYKGTEVFSYPSGVWNPAVTGLAARYWRCSRITNWVTTETFPPAQAAKLRAVGQITSFAGGKSAATVNTMIDTAKANRAWLILIFHKIVTTTPGANTECSLADFQTIMSHLSASGMPVRTMGEVIRLATATVADAAAAGGGMANPMTTLGDIIYENSAPAPARLAGNTSATKNFMTQTGNGSVSAVPAWGTIAAADLPAGTTSTRGALQLDGTASDIQQGGTAAAAGAAGLAADAAHVHPMPLPVPADFSWLAWNGDPLTASSTNLLVAGSVYLMQVILHTPQTISSLSIQITTAGATLTAAQNFAALFDSGGTQRAITADQSSIWTGSGTKTMAVTAPYAAAAGKYWVALLANGTTPPTLRAFAALGNIIGANFGLSGATLRCAVNGTGQTAMPASVTPASNSATGASSPVVAVS